MLRLAQTRYYPLSLALLLLLIFASRVLHLGEIEMHGDEVWVVWQTFGSPSDIAAWTPKNWGVLHEFAIAGWRTLVGIQPFALRLSSVLVFMLGTAFIHRLMSETHNRRAAWIGTLAYAGLGYGVFASIELRVYGILLGILPVFLWLTLRYFRHPTPLRGVAVGLIMGLMFYVQTTSMFAFLMVGMLTLIIYQKRVWRWWLPGGLMLLFTLPEVFGKSVMASRQVGGYNAAALVPVPEFIGKLFRFHTGDTVWFWAVLMLLVFGALLWKRNSVSPFAWSMVVWLFVGAAIYYLLIPITNRSTGRHSWWLLPALALLIGCGFAYLPRKWGGGLALVLAGVMFTPLPVETYYGQPWPTAPLVQNFEWLKQHIRWGDVILVDTNQPAPPCGAQPYKWDYYSRVFFPNGIQFVTEPGNHRRIWYVIHDSGQDIELEGRVREGRIAREFNGPPECLFRLYEGPPDFEGVLFENGLRFHGLDVLDEDLTMMDFASLPRHEGETIRVRFWWSVDHTLEADYSIGAHLYHDTTGELVVQSDSAPQVDDGPPETSRWQPGRYYVEERELILPYPTRVNHLGIGSYTMYLLVYQWWDNVRIEAPGVDEHNRLWLLPIAVKGWS